MNFCCNHWVCVNVLDISKCYRWLNFRKHRSTCLQGIQGTWWQWLFTNSSWRDGNSITNLSKANELTKGDSPWVFFFSSFISWLLDRNILINAVLTNGSQEKEPRIFSLCWALHTWWLPLPSEPHQFGEESPFHTSLPNPWGKVPLGWCNILVAKCHLSALWDAPDWRTSDPHSSQTWVLQKKEQLCHVQATTCDMNL